MCAHYSSQGTPGTELVSHKIMRIRFILITISISSLASGTTDYQGNYHCYKVLMMPSTAPWIPQKTNMEVHPQEGKKEQQYALKTFKGTVSIVTGAASGIGQALVEELTARGARAIILVDRQVALAREVAANCSKKIKDSAAAAQVETKVHDADVRSFESLKQVVAETMEAYGRIDYMFNNAGITISGSVEEIGLEDFNYLLDVNIRGVINGIYAVYPVMKEQSFGHIVNTSSMAGIVPCGEGFCAYATTKYGVIGLTQNLRIEAARHGVKVSAICPGAIDTPIWNDGGTYGKFKAANITPDFVEDIKKMHPFMDSQKFASKALNLVLKNKPIIIVPGWPMKLMWFIHRLFPNFSLYLARKNNDALQKALTEKIAARDADEEAEA